MAARDSDWAFRAYEAVRTRLPSARFAQSPVMVPSLLTLADRFDAFLLDAFGVLNVGERVIESALIAVAGLQAQGKRVMVLTNGATFPAQAALAKYTRLGFSFALADVVASRDALIAGLRCQSGVWGVMAPAKADLGDIPLQTRILGFDPAVYDAVKGFVLLSTADWDAQRQQMLSDSLACNPRPVYVGNPDIVAPREGGLSLEPGYYAHQLADRAPLDLQFFGKPFANIYDLALARLGAMSRTRILMVGDTLHTDILGGAAYGVKTALVTGHGVFQGQDYAAYAKASGLWPDYVMPSP